MRGINHLVLAGHDLEAMRIGLCRVSASPSPRAASIPSAPAIRSSSSMAAISSFWPLPSRRTFAEHGPRSFSFAAFNRDYLARHEGFSMLVFDTTDAKADIQAWSKAGLQTYDPFDFSRLAKMPDGEDVTVGFSLAFVSNPAAPWIGLFACQHFRPDYYEQARYLAHRKHGPRRARGVDLRRRRRGPFRFHGQGNGAWADKAHSGLHRISIRALAPSSSLSRRPL